MMNTRIILLTILISLVFGFKKGNASKNGRIKHSINSYWKFSLGLENKNEAFALHDSLWENVNIPHTWNAEDVMDDIPGYYRGSGWYKKEISLEGLKEREQVFLYFEGANQVTTVYVNEKFAGIHAGGYSAFSFDITPFLEWGQEYNTIIVEVNNEHDENIPPHKADFSYYGGIYRDVYLLVTGEIHFDVLDYASSGVYVSTPTVTDTTALVEIKAKLVNESVKEKDIILQSIIKDESGHEISRLEKNVLLMPMQDVSVLDKSSTIKGHKLWSPDDPYLYTVSTRILDESGNILDEVTSPLGFRYFHFDADSGFYLNGSPCKLVGTSRHQDYFMLANALPDEYHYQDMKQIKDMGMNFVRISHYPQDKAVMEACDQLGLLNAVEIPLIGGVVKTDSFFNVCSNMQREMIRQNYNHPSTIIWAYMNEVQFTPPGGFKDYSLYTEEELTYFEDINELARILEEISIEEDPYRYTNIPMAGNFERFPVGVESGICEIPMIVGWNLYNGWYFEGFEKFDEYVDSLHHVDLKHKPLFITEYGAGADPRIRSEQPRRFDFSVEWQNMFHEHHLQAILERPHVAVSAVWNFADFISEGRKDAVPHINNKGLVTITRIPKDSYYYYQAVLSDKPMVKIAPVNYTIRAGIEKNPGDNFHQEDIWVYTNTSKITLYHNGEKIETRNVTRPKENFTVPFVDGKNTLEIVAVTSNGEIKDFQEVDFILYPKNIMGNTPRSINVNLGSSFYFTDNEGNPWLPEKPYEEGNWGYTAGDVLERENWVGRLLGAEDNILSTDNDPLYQTQRLNIGSFKFDVPAGVYDITLYFADLLTDSNYDLLPGDLKSIENIGETSSFDLIVNNKVVKAGLNIQEQYGKLQGVKYKYRIHVEDNEGIEVTFNVETGVSFLNAISVEKGY